jgi:hypothetical protein
LDRLRASAFFVATVIVVTVLLALGLGRGAHAATLTVVNTNDSGAGSLRQGIADAAPGDTINFDAGLSGQTITLTTGRLEISQNLTITGPAGGIAVSGNNASQVFLVYSGTTVNMAFLTISNGFASSGEGGGIEIGGTLNLTNVNVTGNVAENGGGIAAGGRLNATNSTVSGNTANDLGGGILSGGVVTLTDVTVIGNTAAGGGGIFSSARPLTLANVTISGNSAEGIVFGNPIDGAGGGIFNAGPASLTNVAVTANSARTSGSISAFNGVGGGIFNMYSMSLTNSTVSENTTLGVGTGTGTAGSGGGIFNIGGSLSLANSTVSSNNAQGSGSGTSTFGSGGGIFNIGGRPGVFFNPSSEVSLNNVTVSGNIARSGGGLYNAGNCCGPVGPTPALNLTSTIVAKQLSGMDCLAVGPITSLGYNLDSDGSCALTAAGDLSNMNPMLAPLALNPPGNTQTQALQAGSPAIDHIPPGVKGCGTTISADQRGISRPQGSGCDIGAYELSTAVGGFVELPHAGSDSPHAQGAAGEASTAPIALAGAMVFAALAAGWYVTRRRLR